MRSRLLLVAGILSAAAVAPRNAHADITPWLSVGGGLAAQKGQGIPTPDTAGTFSWAVGAGTTSRAPIVFGALYRMNTYTTLGTDLGAAVRLATGGFARGDWGVALDAGVLWRSWGAGQYGDSPLQGILTLGSPWGLQLAVGTQQWSLDNGVPASGYFCALEIDLLRFTVLRQGSSERWWPNPNPAERPSAPAGQVSLLSF